MYFQVANAARAWFKPIRAELAYDFDGYYFCAMLGIVSGQKAELASSEAVDLTEAFPGDYRDRSRLLIAALLREEVRARHVELDNRAMLDSTLRTLLNPNTPSHLSDDAIRELNKYAQGGFFLLQEEFDETPQSLQSFLLQYAGIIGTAEKGHS